MYVAMICGRDLWLLVCVLDFIDPLATCSPSPFWAGPMYIGCVGTDGQTNEWSPVAAGMKIQFTPTCYKMTYLCMYLVEFIQHILGYLRRVLRCWV